MTYPSSPQALKAPRTQSCHVRRKTHAQQVDVMDHARAMPQSHHVAGTTPLGQQRLNGVLDAAVTEVAKKRISRAQGQESQRGALAAQGLREQTVHHFVRSSIAPDRDEVANSPPVSLACNLRRLPRSARRRDLDLKASRLQPLQSRAEQLPALSAASRRIHDRKVCFPQDFRSHSTLRGRFDISRRRSQGRHGPALN